GFSQLDWFTAFLEGNAAAGSAGAMFWILTPDPRRGYGVTYSTDRDRKLIEAINRAAKKWDVLQAADPPSFLTDSERHLIPRQFAWSRGLDEATSPTMTIQDDKTILYKFRPQMATSQRFEKIGSGPGYIWGYGSGFVEYTIPERADRRRVSEIVVRAHIQPVSPIDAT